MNGPKRLLESGPGRLRVLVEAGKRDLPDRVVEQRVLGALGLGVAGGAGLAGASGGLARSGGVGFLEGLRRAALSKVGIGVVATAAASSAGYLASREHGGVQSAATGSAMSSMPAVAPPPLESPSDDPGATVEPVPAITASPASVARTMNPVGPVGAMPVVARGVGRGPGASAVVPVPPRASGRDDMAPSKGPGAVSTAPSMAAQLESIRRARGLVASGDARAALVELDAYEAQSPHGIFEEEAMALRVRALRLAGDAAGAARERMNLQARFPRSIHLAALGHSLQFESQQSPDTESQ